MGYHILNNVQIRLTYLSPQTFIKRCFMVKLLDLCFQLFEMYSTGLYISHPTIKQHTRTFCTYLTVSQYPLINLFLFPHSYSPLPLITTIVFSEINLFQIPHKSEIMLSLYFHAWFISLNIEIFSFINIVTNDRISLFV